MNRRSVLAVLCLVVTGLAAPARAQQSCAGVAAWTDCCGCRYTQGQKVTYANNLYHATQAFTNTCGAGWNPAGASALWSLDGACGLSATATATVTATRTATATATRTSSATPTGTTTASTPTATATRTPTAVVDPVLSTNFQAFYWTQGDDPCTHNGPAGSGQPWVAQGSCYGSTCWPAWGAGFAYTGASKVSRNCLGGTATATRTPTATTTSTATPTRTATATATRTTTALVGYETYLVASGDTLASIASRMGSTGPSIAALNHITTQTPLRIGRPLVIPVLTAAAKGAGGLIVYQANTTVPKVALTFDTERWEGTPTAVYTILDALRTRHLHATFMLCGNWTTDLPAIAQAILADGHEIGDHTVTHPDFTTLTVDQATSEIEGLEATVQQATNTTTRPYFRFPYGSSNATMTDLLAKHGYIAYHWAAVDDGVGTWINQIRANPQSGYGAILLMHSMTPNATSLGGWLDQITALGIIPTTLTDALN